MVRVGEQMEQMSGGGGGGKSCEVSKWNDHHDDDDGGGEKRPGLDAQTSRFITRVIRYIAKEGLLCSLINIRPRSARPRNKKRQPTVGIMAIS